VAHDLRADLDQLLLQTGERPVFEVLKRVLDLCRK
jgi:hypothetical protein